MTRRDDFDDPQGFENAFGKIAYAMESSRAGLKVRRPMLSLMTVLVALFVLFAVFWSTYPRGSDVDNNESPVPIIRADASPYKIAPDDRGGMEIPYRDSTIFETIHSAEADDTEGAVESLLPPPEEPISKDQMFAGLKTDPISDSPVDRAVGEAVGVTDDFGPVATANDSETSLVPAEKTTDLSAYQPAPAGTPVPGMKPARGVEPVTVAAADTDVTQTEPAAGNASASTANVDDNGTHYIQLGSVKDRMGAQDEWKKLQSQFPSELGDLTLRVQEANLGEKGTFYRIQGGTISAARAKDICSAISARRSGGCLVVAR